ncbi:Uncharacterised protein [Campylobacter jejuni subsp. doylei]|uniref:Uncharacterized protein n=1 Tax=Campylobacter jejuni subsp. doylei TaxID=32021 RepID=A0A3S5EKK8_CAMJU|nr:hypothetical protein [Campylobacter jejuni]VEG59935.1 Uncharacterised protein [Campylobacter jejuni subsp. doylei]VEG60813.1 Uncharacterised protein [Campylobacter jejuni subsp. doylei]VEG62176.1 Uncharacterised protein [Campylobacter jejuni subsp. doylei]VEG62954.1 Uncharacterised protein [Campylobacter jejuni subsp. doylei]
MDNITSANKLRNQNEILKPKENDDQKALFLEEQQKTLEENEETMANESLKNKETKKGKQDK